MEETPASDSADLEAIIHNNPDEWLRSAMKHIKQMELEALQESDRKIGHLALF